MKLFCLFAVLIFVGLASADEGCDLKQLKSSKLDISIKDSEFLKQMMTFSYQNQAQKFAPQVTSAFSGMYYKGSKNEPLVTYLFASYKTPQVAKQAADFLKSHWMTNRTGPQYDVSSSGNDVFWISNNSLSASCFKKIVTTEKAKVFKK